MWLECRGWHKYCEPNQIKSGIKICKVYLYQMYTTIFVEFDTIYDAKMFKQKMDEIDSYWDYDPVAIIDTNNTEQLKHWQQHIIKE